MSTSVVMPQMGESVAEGTIVRWIKKVGDFVDRDEPLFEISTDKVDAEIPAPVAGILLEVKVQEGETVAVDSEVATIGSAEEAKTSRPAPVAPEAASARTEQDSGRGGALGPEPSDRAGEPRRQRTSPLVRRIARDHNVDISRITGSGLGGRVTKRDILGHLERGAPPGPGSAEVEIKPLSVMRRKIAEHMVMSRRTSAHVHSVFHVDFSRVRQLREQARAEHAERGGRLTYMAFIVRAAAIALGRFPILNASLDGNNVVYKKDINIGIAVAIESGLIVPVIRRADEMDLFALSQSIADVADRARSKHLNPDEVNGGTFTITNHGQFGSQFGLPIINQPQVAILGVGAIEKRPVVVDDAIVIRTMAYLTLGYDHRLIDGATGEEFMSVVKQQIEQFDTSQS